MEEVDKGCLMIRMGVNGWVFLLVPAHLGSPGQRVVKRLCVCVCVCVRACICACVWVLATDCVLEILLLTQCGEAQHMDSSLSWLGEWSSWEWEFLHSSASIPCCFLQQSVHSTGHCSCSFFYTAVVYCLTHSICHFYNLQGLHCMLSSLMPCTVGAECCVWQVFVRLKDLKGQKCVQSFRPKDYLEACVRVRVRVCV